MTYHLSSEQYQRGVNHVTSARVVAATPGSTLTRNPAYITGLAKMLAHLADVPVSKVMRDSDARLADLDSPLAPTLVCSSCRDAACAAGDLMCDDARTASFVEIPAVRRP